MKKYYVFLVVLFSISSFSQDVIMQNGIFNRCEPNRVFDSGGEAGNYGSNENFVTTICPEAADQFIVLNFTAFSTQLNQDFLTIYDGADTTAPIIGTYSGGSGFSPGNVQASASNTSGCLTLQFVSNATGTTTGFAADILCGYPCQNITASIDSTVPAASGGIVSILPGESVDFEGSATFSDDGTGATYSWNFGNGNNATGQSVSNTYLNPGTFNVVLTVTDTNPQGCSDTAVITVFVLAPNVIVDQTIYTVEELVLDVLIDSPCADVSNITFSTGTNFNNDNGIGYFYGDGVNFPFSAGLIMTSGDALRARGPNNNALSEGGWPGDTDIEAVAGVNTNDASIIEFDFVPLANSISFDFLMASEEYNGSQGGTFECTFSDAFAFLLTDQNGVTTNLAVLPGTTTPILVTNIHPANPGCGAINEQYFGGYTPQNGPPISFDGRTTVFTAQSPVNPGETYHIKLVIADASDNQLDSGVFIEAGSFNLGGNIGDDLTIVGNNAACEGDTITLDTQLTSGTFVWYKDSVVIPGEIGPTLTVDAPGVYTVDIELSSSCQTSDSILIEFYPPAEIQNVNNLYLCNPGAPPYIFDLEENTPVILATTPIPADYVVTYHETQANADADTGAISPANAYVGTDGQIIYVRLEYLTSGCYNTETFTLNITSQPILNAVPDLEVCDDASNDGFAQFDLESQTLGILGAQASADFTVTYHTSFANADTSTGALTSPYTNTSNPQPIYVRIESVGDASCNNVSATPLFNLVVLASDDAGFTMTPTCDGGTATVTGTLGGTFTFNPVPTDGAVIDPTNGTVTGGTSGATYTVEYTTNGTCPSSSTQDVTVLITDDASFTLTATCDGGTATITGDLGGTFTFANPQPTDGATIDPATGEVTGGTPSATYNIIYTTAGVCPSSTTLVLNVLPIDNAGFTMTPTCDGATANVTGDTGGTFTFNPVPTDGAIIDPADGTVTNGTSGATYTVEYTTIGTSCPQTSAVTFTVEITDDASFTMTPTCDGATATIDGTTGGSFAFNPMPVDGAMIDPLDGTVIGGISGTSYTVEYTTDGTCPSSSTETFTVITTDDSTFTMTATCDGGTAIVTGVTGGSFALNPDPGDGSVIDPATGTVTGGISGATYTVEYTTNGVCPSSSTEIFTVIPTDDATFTMTATCDGGTATVTGTTGGSFAFNPLPGDGAVINATTGTITSGTSGATYTVEYTTNGTCPSSSTQDVTVLITDDASFTLTATCDGGTATITGDLGGTFTFANPQPTDGATIDPATGEVTGGTPSATYNIIYTTAGVCPSSTTLVLNVLPIDNAGFTMTPTCDGATANITGVTGGLFTFTTPPADAAVIDPATGEVTGGTPGATYTVTYTTNGICPNTSDVTFTANPLPLVVAPTPLEVCDDNVPDGFTEIDLTLKNTEITGNTPTSIVSYYLTQAEADAGDITTALPIPYTNIANPQTVYVRVENVNTGCYDTTTLQLIVEQALVANVPTPLEYCDPDSDGFGVFDIASTENEITGGVAGLSVTYHETLSNAENGVNELSSPYNNIVANTQTIYVRIESETIATDCATIVPLVLIVNPTPQIEDPTPLEVCDDALADGFAQFDLTTKNAEILDGLDAAQYIVSYYELEADAEVPTNVIATPAAYTNTVAFNQTLWVRVDDTVNGCFKITSLDLIVNALPVLVQPTELTLCDVDNSGDEMEAFNLEDANAEILNGQTGITLTYYETQADADLGSNPITSPYVNMTNPQTVYVRAENDNTGCVSTITLTLRVDPIPSPVVPNPIEVCDEDNDGFASFDLESRTVEIINGELDIQITYHETEEDANAGQDPLVSPYNNIVANSQIVHARAENTITGCFTVVPLQLIVLLSPEIPVDLDDYVICDTNDDGFAQFDLTTKNAEILGVQPPADFTLTYHLNQANADLGTNPIINVANYTNVTNPQTIYVRLVSAANGCVSTGQFDIRVELPPVAIQPTPLALCDDDVDDEFTVFDLTVKNTEITGGEGSWSVSYYETSADAQADTNVIDPDTAYTNTVNPQTLFVRVTDTDTGCTDFVTLTIRVLPNPTPGLNPENLALCDDINTGDGQEVFDLTENEAYIINGEVGVTASYYADPDDAEAGVNAIADPTMYTNANTDYTAETIYVRVTNNVTGCYTIVQFNIIVNPLPEVVAVTDYIICELNNDGAAGFDLTTKDAEVLNGQDPSIFEVTYHVSQADADNLNNALVSPYINVSNPQPIYVAITNNVTGCSISTQVFNLEVQEAAQANPDMEPINYVICDNIGDNDGFGQFDLTTQDAEVLDGQDPANYIVSYYFTEADAELGVNPLPFTYENVTNPQVIYARVDNDTPDGTGVDTSICYAVTPLTLQVNLLPIFDLEDTYTLCVNTNGTEVINPPVLDTGLSTADYTFEWSLDATVLPGETGSSLTATQPGTYSVLVTNNVTGCQNTDSALVESSSPPTLVAEVTTQAFSENHVIVAEATGDGTYEYSLDGGPWQSSGTFTDVSFGEHIVTARDIEGCGLVSVTVFVMDYPKFFTPNGDGYHDTWNIVGIANQPSAKIYIFDRYGKLLKQISPTGQGWNGTYNGEPMPTSDYWFTVEYNEPSTGQRKEFKAHFTLKR